jgi:hypothetical protein
MCVKTTLSNLFFISRAGVKTSSLLLRLFIGLLYKHFIIDGDDCGAISGMDGWQGKRKCSSKTCHSIALSTKDAT